MTPYAEAGHRSLLFGKDVHIVHTNGAVQVHLDNEPAIRDVLLLHKEPDEIRIQSDILGAVYVDGKKQKESVHIPKSATITKRVDP